MQMKRVCNLWLYQDALILTRQSWNCLIKIRYLRLAYRVPDNSVRYVKWKSCDHCPQKFSNDPHTYFPDFWPSSNTFSRQRKRQRHSIATFRRREFSLTSPAIVPPCEKKRHSRRGREKTIWAVYTKKRCNYGFPWLAQTREREGRERTSRNVIARYLSGAKILRLIRHCARVVSFAHFSLLQTRPNWTSSAWINKLPTVFGLLS